MINRSISINMIVILWYVFQPYRPGLVCRLLKVSSTLQQYQLNTGKILSVHRDRGAFIGHKYSCYKLYSSQILQGAFGTLGVGGGFALGAKLCRPESEVAFIYYGFCRALFKGSFTWSKCALFTWGMDRLRWRLLGLQRCRVWHLHEA